MCDIQLVWKLNVREYNEYLNFVYVKYLYDIL